MALRIAATLLGAATVVVVALVVATLVLAWQAAHGFPLLTVARGVSDVDGGENRALWRDGRFRAVAVAYPVLCVVTWALGGRPYYPMPLVVPLVAAGSEPARWRTCGRGPDRRP